MSPPYERSGPNQETASPDTQPTVVKPNRLTQRERVRNLLLEGWVCGSEFVQLSPPIIRYGGRIHDLRKEGFWITRRVCESHSHPDSLMFEWRIESVPEKQDGQRCPSCMGIIAHVSSCPSRRVERVDGQLFGGILR